MKPERGVGRPDSDDLIPPLRTDQVCCKQVFLFFFFFFLRVWPPMLLWLQPLTKIARSHKLNLPR